MFAVNVITRRNVQTHLDHLNLNFSTLLKTLVFLVSLQLCIFPSLVSFSYRAANSYLPGSDSFTKGGALRAATLSHPLSSVLSVSAWCKKMVFSSRPSPLSPSPR